MPKIEVEINQETFNDLERIGKANGGLTVKQIIQQEVDDALINAEIWLQRGKDTEHSN